MAPADLRRPALAEHVIKPAIDSFNKVANARWKSSSTPPTSWCRPASCSAPCRTAPSTRCSPTTPPWPRRSTSTSVRRLLPVRHRYSLDVPVLFNQYGLNEIWECGAYGEVENVNLALRRRRGIPATSSPRIRSTASPTCKGKRVFTFPTAGRSCRRFGVVPVTLPWEDIECRSADRRSRRHRLVRHHRGLHGRLGRCHQLLPDQQHLRRLVRFVLRQYRSAGTQCRRICRSCSSSPWTSRTITGSTGTGAVRRKLRTKAPRCSSPPFPTEEWAHRGRTPRRSSGTRSRPRAPDRAKVVQIYKDYNADTWKKPAAPTATADFFATRPAGQPRSWCGPLSVICRA